MPVFWLLGLKNPKAKPQACKSGLDWFQSTIFVDWIGFRNLYGLGWFTWIGLVPHFFWIGLVFGVYMDWIGLRGLDWFSGDWRTGQGSFAPPPRAALPANGAIDETHPPASMEARI